MSRVITSDPGAGTTSTTAATASVIIDDVTPSATRVFSSLHLTNGTADLTLRDLTVQGTQTIINSSTVEMNDPVIDLNRGGTAAPLGGLRIISPSGAAPNKMIVYDTADDGLRAGTEGSTRALAFRTETPANLRALTWNSAAKELVSMPDTSLTAFVSKSGNDANDGRTPQTAKLTVAAALAIASTDWRVDVGPGFYTEAATITVPTNVHVDAETSDFTGSVILSPGSAWVWRTHRATAARAIQADGSAYVDLRRLWSTAPGVSAFRVITGSLFVRCDIIDLASGDVVDETNAGPIGISFGRISVTANGTLARAVNACQVSLEGGQVTLAGAGSRAFVTTGALVANFYLQCASLSTPGLTDINAGTVCNIVCAELLGAVTEIGAGRAKIASPSILKAPAYEIAAPTLVSNVTDAVSFSTGALRTLGGCGITKNLHVGLDARVEGSVGIGGNTIGAGTLQSFGAVTFNSTCSVAGAVPATSTITGALRVPNGGVGVTGAVYAGSLSTAGTVNAGTVVATGNIVATGNAIAAAPLLPAHLTTKAYVDALATVSTPTTTWNPMLSGGINIGSLGVASYTRFSRTGTLVSGNLSVPITAAAIGPIAFGFELPIPLSSIVSATIRTVVGDASTSPLLFATSVAVNPNTTTTCIVSWTESSLVTTRVDIGFSYCI